MRLVTAWSDNAHRLKFGRSGRCKRGFRIPLSTPCRHSREGGNPAALEQSPWIPGSAARPRNDGFWLETAQSTFSDNARFGRTAEELSNSLGLTDDQQVKQSQTGDFPKAAPYLSKFGRGFRPQMPARPRQRCLSAGAIPRPGAKKLSIRADVPVIV